MLSFITWNRRVYKYDQEQGEEREGKLVFKEHRVSGWDDEKVPEMGSGNGCST